MTRLTVLLAALILVSLATLLSSGCTSMPSEPGSEKIHQSYDAIIQLHEMEQGRFYCSAVVVYRNYAITAAHCVAENSAIKIFSSRNQDTGIVAVPDRASSQMDYAVISGDFSKFRYIKPELNVKEIIKSFTTGDLIACGYPMGGELICLPIKDPGQYNFYFRADGSLYPGMSGGPVIDKKTGHVIGINSAVYTEGVLLAPIINLLFGLNL